MNFLSNGFTEENSFILTPGASFNMVFPQHFVLFHPHRHLRQKLTELVA
jgi:hypothetical protein